MSRNALVICCFAVCAASVGVASGTFTPVAYGAGEMTPQVGIAGLLSTITALVSGAGGIMALLRNSTVTQFAKDAVSHITNRDVGSTALDAAFVTIAAVILSKKSAIDPATLTELGVLRKKIETLTETPK